MPEITRALRVGPESAGAEPGPALYGKGGERPTVTDAHAVLGHFPNVVLAGEMQLDMDAASRAVRTVAESRTPCSTRGGSWGDPLERDPAIVALEVDRGLVTRAGARRYGVVLDADGGVDEEATRELRETMRRERSEPGLFDYGDTIENIFARCESETGLPPPSRPDFDDRRLLAKNPVVAG